MLKRARVGRCGTTAIVLSLGVITTGCVGSVPRASFEAELRERGAGITGAQIDQAIEIAAREAAVADPDALEVIGLTADARTRVIVVQPRRGDQPDFVDVITVRDGEILSVSPVQDADRLDLEASVVPVAVIPVDDAETFVDRAIEEFGDPDTLVSSYGVARRGAEVAIVVEVESPRRTGSVVFDLDGQIIEVTS